MFVKSYSNYNSWAKPGNFTKRKIFAKWLGAMKSEYQEYDSNNLYELCKQTTQHVYLFLSVWKSSRSKGTTKKQPKQPKGLMDDCG